MRNKTRSLNLDGMFVPVPLPEIEFNLMKFSGGESHIKLNNQISYDDVFKVVITNRIRNSDDIINILIAKDALELKGVKEFDLIIPYIPYARQDRKCFNGESFTLKVFSNLINSASFNTVYSIDAHSDVAPALINNCKNISNEQYVKSVYLDIADHDNADVLLISPDSGANKKANKLLSDIEFFSGLVKCDKVRSVIDGSLSGFEVFSNDLENKPCLIVDDICDGGGTFIGLAEELKKKNAGNIYLFVTHGIFSKGTEIFEDLFSGIYCTNSFSDIDNNNNVKQVKIKL